MSFRSGKDGAFWTSPAGPGRVRWAIKRWSVTPKNQLQDVTTGNSGGVCEYISGVGDLDFSVDFDHDVGTDPFDTFVPGVILSYVYLLIDNTDFTYWTIPTAIVDEVSETLDVRGLVVCTLRCTATAGGWSLTETGVSPP